MKTFGFKKGLILMAVAMPLILAGCGSSKITDLVKGKVASSGDTKWVYEKAITEPIKAKSGADDVKLGDLDTSKVYLAIPKNTFDAETDVEIKTPDSVPEYLGKEVKMIGSPIEITVGDQKRLNEPVVITFAFNKNDIDPVRGESNIRVAYFSGDQWEYIKPDSIDMEKGTITFTTFHFSLFGQNQIKDDTVITEAWVHSKTLDKEMKKGFNKVSDKVADKLIDMTLAKMGITDKTLKGKILAEILKDDGYKKIYESAVKGNVAETNQKIALLAGKKIASIVPASTLQGALKSLTGSGVGNVEAVSKAAGYIAGGQYADAAKVIAEKIADSSMIATAGKVAAEVVDGQITSWKNAEMEAAYTAFNKGSNATFYGYNNDKGDFGAVWEQMRGIRRQVELEAIKKENKVRAEAGMPPLTEAQAEVAREGVKLSYQSQFEKRAEKEEETKVEEDRLKLLVKTFRDNNMFDSTLGPVGLDRGLDYEGKLDVLNYFAEKMMQDTGRFELSDKNGLVMDGKISVDDIAQGARLWFSGPEGKKAYAKFLLDRFKISLAPALKDLAGAWQAGQLMFDDVIVPPGYIEKMAANKDKPGTGTIPDGCDLNIDLTKLKGRSTPATIAITPSGENSGTLTLTTNKPISFPITYEDGVIAGSFSDSGAVMNIELSVSEGDSSYSGSGPLTISYGEIKIMATLTGTKPITKPATPPAAPIK